MARCFWDEGTPTLDLGGSHSGHPLCVECIGQVGEKCPVCDVAYTPADKERIKSFIQPTPRPQEPPVFKPGPPVFKQGPAVLKQGPPQFNPAPPPFQPAPPSFNPGLPSFKPPPPSFNPNPPAMKPAPPPMKSSPPAFNPGPSAMKLGPPVFKQGPPFPIPAPAYQMPKPGSSPIPPPYTLPPQMNPPKFPPQGPPAFPPNQIYRPPPPVAIPPRGIGLPAQQTYPPGPSSAGVGDPSITSPLYTFNQSLSASLGRVSPCGICSRLPTDPVKMSCGHTFCRDELKESLTKQAARGKDVKCPNETCKFLVPAYFLMMVLEKEAFQTYRLEHLKNIIVTCPRCTVIEQIGAKHKVVECTNCELHYCSRCTKDIAACRCLVPREITCPQCTLVMHPKQHKLMVCGNCNATCCTFCGMNGERCNCNYNALTAVTQMDDVVKCSVCYEYISIDKLDVIISMEGCKCVFHKECIQGHIVSKLESGQFSTGIGCPTPGCEGKVGIFEKLVSKQQWDMYNEKLMERNYKLVQCPNQSCLEKYSVEIEVQEMTCPKCSIAFCLKCKEAPHPGTSCSRSHILSRIREMEAAGQMVAQCPGCKLPYLKDDHCDHVTCGNEECKVEFCFSCSCLRKPTTEHCNAWHRPDCRFYNPVGASEEKKRANCPECQRLGRLCDPPKRLRVPRHFDEDES